MPRQLKVKNSKRLGGERPAAYETKVYTLGITPVSNVTFDKARPLALRRSPSAASVLTAS